jgi:hypothetical protein
MLKRNMHPRHHLPQEKKASPPREHGHGHQHATYANVRTEPLADARQLPDDADRTAAAVSQDWIEWNGDGPVLAAVHEGGEDVVGVGACADGEEQAHEEGFEVEERRLGGLVGQLARGGTDHFGGGGIADRG